MGVSGYLVTPLLKYDEPNTTKEAREFLDAALSLNNKPIYVRIDGGDLKLTALAVRASDLVDYSLPILAVVIGDGGILRSSFLVALPDGIILTEEI